MSKPQGIWSRLRGTKDEPQRSPSKAVRKTAPQLRPNKAEIRSLPDVSPWLGTLVLGLWDNTCGPRIDQVWLGTKEPLYDEDMLSYAVRLTLASEIGVQDAAGKERMTAKFHLFGELETMIVSTTFSVFSSDMPDATSYKYALILLCSSQHLSRYLQVAEVVEDRLFRLCTAIKMLLEKRLPASGYVPHLLMFMQHLDALFSLAPQWPPVSPTFRHFEHPFLGLALTAHLQAGCRSIVIGSNGDSLQQMLDILCVFMCPRQLCRVRMQPAHVYVPDLDLQAVFLDADMAQPVLDEALVMQSLNPTALINMDTGRVYATDNAPQYAALRREFVAAEVAALLRPKQPPPDPGGIPAVTIESPRSPKVVAAATNLSGPIPSSPPISGLFTAVGRPPVGSPLAYPGAPPAASSWKTPSDSLFRPCRRASPWCMDVLVTVSSLPRALRLPVAVARFKALRLRAVALCRGVEEKMSPAHLAKAVLGPLLPEAVAPDQAPSPHPDYLILLALTEVMRPGTYVQLAGDPNLLESKFVELFDSF